MSKVVVVVISFMFSLCMAGGISQAGNGCGTWYIQDANCSAISSSQYWDFVFSFTQPGTGSVNTTTNVQVGVTTSYNDRWGLYLTPSQPNVCVSGSSTNVCGTFSATAPCNQQCDASLNPICQGFSVTAPPQSTQTIRFGIRKNNNGSGPCAVTLAAFLPTTSGLTATCKSQLSIDSSCPGSLTLGFNGPLLYSAAHTLNPSLIFMLLSMLLLATMF